jgi:hypothetical protein
MTFQTFTGREYLKIDIASNFGLDKISWDDRIAWFDANESQLDNLVQSAKEPALFYAGVKAWREVMQGKPIGYMVSFDATSSGLQLLAALTGDRSAAELCNVVDTGKREDAYTRIYQLMMEILGETGQISRDQVKEAIMTALYGSKAVPKRVFGEGELLNLFYKTMERVAPAAWELNEAFLAMWDPTALINEWVLPDNFHVKVKVMSQVADTVHFLNAPYEVTYKINAPMEEGRSLGANTIHSIDGMVVRELTRRCDYSPAQLDAVRSALAGPGGQRSDRPKDQLLTELWDHYRASGYLSARILDHIDAENVGLIDPEPVWELLGSLPERPFKVVSIHDCFRCLPHYVNDLRRQYNLQLQLIAKSDLLQFLLSQIMRREVNITKFDPTLYMSIGETNYALS